VILVGPHANSNERQAMLPMPEHPFMPPIPFRELLAQLDAWPSPDPWPFVGAETTVMTMETPVVLLIFDRCEAFDDDEHEAFERCAASQGLYSFLNVDQLVDVRESLASEIERLEDEADIAIVHRNYDDILIRAINHYNEMDAFISLKDWVGSDGLAIKGVLVDYA
jgi:hypothetical protein